jgi:Zn-dependent peptidase ImmA (M78 family)/transcriptional regulator with XRE-family HTH domain
VIEERRLTPALFDGERLTLARLYRGLRKGDVAQAIGVTAASVGQYEQGRTRPSAPVLAALALHLGFPPDFFEKGRPLSRVHEAEAHFRRLRATTKRERDGLLARLSLLAELVLHVEQRVELPAVNIPEAIVEPGDLDSAEAAANRVRQEWGLGQGPIDNMVKLLETKGAIVTRPTVDTSDIDAFSTWVQGRPVVVLANDKTDAGRSRFDAAHELGHLVMHQDAAPGLQALERQAQRFAAAFLLPAESLRRELPTYVRWGTYFDLKLRWRVSIAALLYRARTLGVLSADSYQRAQIHIARQGWKTAEPVDLGPPEEPRLLPRALELISSALNVQLDDIGHDMRLPTDVFQSLLLDVAVPGSARPTLKLV